MFTNIFTSQFSSVTRRVSSHLQGENVSTTTVQTSTAEYSTTNFGLAILIAIAGQLTLNNCSIEGGKFLWIFEDPEQKGPSIEREYLAEPDPFVSYAWDQGISPAKLQHPLCQLRGYVSELELSMDVDALKTNRLKSYRC